jgi:hypothetical protein
MLRTITANELKIIIENHKLWLEDKPGGVRADLRSADLSSANLSSANLSSANLSSADLSSADLSSADLRYANLSSADLRSANLRYADLRYADPRYADLRHANLRSADLRYANLRSAVGINEYLCTPLLMLLDQPGKIRAYKLIKAEGEGPYNGGINYLEGKTFEAKANMDVTEQCGAGINLATLDWCMKEWRGGYRILIMEFTAKCKDGTPNICIPTATDGKFRVHECKRVGEKDLVEIGLIKKEEEKK